MPRKPIIEYDFSRGHMVDEDNNLPRKAVLKLRELGLPVNKLQLELRAYLRAKPVNEIRPRQLLQIIVRYVDVQPTDYRDLEERVGAEAARNLVPGAEEIPMLTWATMDYLSYLDPDYQIQYRDEVLQRINSMVGDKHEYLRLCAKWLNRAGSTPNDAMTYYLRQQKSRRQNRRPTPV